MMDLLPSVTQAFSLIKHDEKQKQGFLPTITEGTSFMVNQTHIGKQAQGYNNTNIKSYSSNQGHGVQGHGQAITHGQSSGFKQLLKCTYCNGDNHIRETCFKLNGYRPKKKKKGKPANTTNTNYNFRPACTGSKVMQVGGDAIGYGPASYFNAQGNQLEQMQSQINQMSHMMNMMMMQNKTTHDTPEDHVAGPEQDELTGSW